MLTTPSQRGSRRSRRASHTTTRGDGGAPPGEVGWAKSRNIHENSPSSVNVPSSMPPSRYTAIAPLSRTRASSPGAGGEGGRHDAGGQVVGARSAAQRRQPDAVNRTATTAQEADVVVLSGFLRVVTNRRMFGIDDIRMKRGRPSMRCLPRPRR